LPPGASHIDRKNVWVGTGSDPVRLGQIQPPGKKFMNAVDWARGARLDPAVRAT
jgi:methionyl-tRNA formyltransferase